MVLAQTSEPLSARALRLRARRGSDRGVRLVLARLSEQGLVREQPAGSATLYTLNEDHIAAPVVHALADLRRELLARIRADIDTWHIQPDHASVFGSAARLDGDLGSDIDLLVVRPSGVDQDAVPWRDQLDGLTEAITRWTGNKVGLAEIGADDVRRLRKERPAIVDELQQDAIDIAGQPVRTLLKTI